jgi:hypothetical protein
MINRRIKIDHPIDDRLSILDLTDLEIWRIHGRLNKIPFRVYMIKVHVLTLDLTTQNKIAAKIHRRLLLATIPADHFPYSGANQFRHLEKGALIEQVGHVVPQPGAQQTQYTLGGGQIARAQQNNLPLTGQAKAMQFSECGNMIDPRVSPGIRQKNHAGRQPHGYAIGHYLSPERHTMSLAQFID